MSVGSGREWEPDQDSAREVPHHPHSHAAPTDNTLALQLGLRPVLRQALDQPLHQDRVELERLYPRHPVARVDGRHRLWPA